MNAYNSNIHYTSYPHIVKVKGACGGEAIIEGTRIAVWHIVGYYTTGLACLSKKFSPIGTA